MSRFEWWYSHSSMTTRRRVIRRNVKWRSDKNADLMTFRQLTRHPVVVEEWEYHHSNRLVATSRMVVFSFLYTYWMPRNAIKSAFLSLRHLTFRQIYRLRVVVGEWEYHYSTRLDEPVRMVVFPFFYDLWTPRYSTKRHQIGVFITFGTAPFDVLSNILTSSDRRRMGIQPFQRSR